MKTPPTDVQCLIKEYKSKLISKYIPPDPDISVINTIDIPMAVCSHSSYQSPDAFIDHLLWVLHPKSLFCAENEKHCTSIHKSLYGHIMCTNCINLMLYKVTFTDIINLYSIWTREIKIIAHLDRSPRGGLCNRLLLHLCTHPKIFKIMIKSFQFNKTVYLNGEKMRERSKVTHSEQYVHDFDFLSDILCGEIQSSEYNPQSTETESDEYFLRIQRENAKVISKAFYLSIKYWKKYHFLYFARHYLLELERLWIDIYQLSQKDLGLGDVNFLVGRIVCNVCIGARKLRCNQIGNWEVMGVLKKYLKRTENEYDRKEIWKQVKTQFICKTTCGWYGCGKTQTNASKFKVCKQCKMTYYCSKHCQKRSWNSEHRNKCKILCNVYKL
eukprot:383334_1